jgi:DNA (cytosine-5)-methyltransferase 1
MNGLSLCSGIGGIDLGLALAIPSYRTVCHVEIQRTCQDLLLARMADGLLDHAPIWGDLKQFDGRPWRGLVDVVHGGYPCQPFSFVGKRLGKADPRQRYLWPHIRRIVSECEPEWCFFENVAGHLSLEGPDVVRDLVDMGYQVAAGIFTAAEVGAPHPRERFYILAHALTQPRPPAQERKPLAERPTGGNSAVEGQPGGPTVGYPRACPPDRMDPAWGDIIAADPTLHPCYGGRLNHTFVEWLMGFPRGWTEGMSRTARLRALGNAVLPPVAALAWLELLGDLRRAGHISKEDFAQ